MSIWRRYTRRDANEPAIVKVAEQMGATWQALSIRGGPDGMVGVCGRVALVEIKVPRGKVRPTQEKWHKWWRGPFVRVVRTEEDMQDVVNSLRSQK